MNSKNPLSSREITDFIHRFSTESKKVLAVLIDQTVGLFFALAGKLEMNQEGILVLHGDGDPSLLEVPVFLTSTVALLTAVCEFTEPRTLNGFAPPGFFEHEVPFSCGLTFIFPKGSILCLLEIE